MEEQLMIDIMYYGVLCSMVIGLIISYFQAHKINWERYKKEVKELSNNNR